MFQAQRMWYYEVYKKARSFRNQDAFSGKTKSREPHFQRIYELGCLLQNRDFQALSTNRLNSTSSRRWDCTRGLTKWKQKRWEDLDVHVPRMRREPTQVWMGILMRCWGGVSRWRYVRDCCEHELVDTEYNGRNPFWFHGRLFKNTL